MNWHTFRHMHLQNSITYAESQRKNCGQTPPKSGFCQQAFPSRPPSSVQQLIMKIIKTFSEQLLRFFLKVRAFLRHMFFCWYWCSQNQDPPVLFTKHYRWSAESLYMFAKGSFRTFKEEWKAQNQPEKAQKRTQNQRSHRRQQRRLDVRTKYVFLWWILTALLDRKHSILKSTPCQPTSSTMELIHRPSSARNTCPMRHHAQNRTTSKTGCKKWH